MKLFKPKLSTLIYPLSVILSLFAAGAARGDDCSTWSQVSDALKNGRDATLMADVVQDTATPCTISSAADVTLDLNGHTLTRYAGDVRLIVLNAADATLTVKGEGTVDGTADGLTQNGGCFSVASGKLVLESGTLKGKAPNGGAVAVSGSGVFEMKGGAITGSSATTKYGGGVYMNGNGARIVISGGEISGCTANQGGGIAAYRGSVSFSGGTIAYCTVSHTGDYGAGGGVLVYDYASLAMSGGTITHCQCSNWGGGIFFYGGGTISGGTIEYCRSDSYGGAINYQGYGEERALTISGGVFRGNSAYYSGGAFYTYDTYAPNATISGGQFVDNWTDKVQGDTIYVASGMLTVRGGVFKPWNGEYAVAESGSAAIAGSSLTVVGKDVTLLDDQVVLGTLTFDPLAAEYADIPLVDTNRSTVVKGESTWTVDTPGLCWTWEEVRATLSGGTNVTLMADVVQDTATPCTISSAANVTLDLNGHSLTRYAGDAQLIVLNAAGATLTVKGEGVVDGTADGLTQDGGCFYVNDGKLVLESGTLKGKAKYGGAVTVNRSSAAFEMRGGKITGSAATGSEKRGGGVYVVSGRFIMSGGSIESNSTDGSGGGVYVLYGSVEVIDGAFRNNSARYGGAIFEYHGSASIKGGFFAGNSATYADSDNLYLDQDVTVSGGVFEGGLKSTGVVYPSGYAAVVGTTLTVVGKDLVLNGDTIVSGTLTFDPLAKTYDGLGIIDMDTAIVTKSGDTWLVSSQPASPVECSTWGELSNTLSQGLNAKLTCDVTQDAGVCEITCLTRQTLDLNGHSLTRKSGTRLLALNASGATLTVTGEGTIDGTVDTLGSNGGCISVAAGTFVLESGTLKGKAANGGAVAVEGSSATFEMRGGTISSSSASSCGGGLYVDYGSFLMTGGTIANCHAKSYGGGAALSYADTTISGGEISGCSTDLEGGGLYADHGSLTIEGGRFQSNTASKLGGAVSSKGASVSVRGGVYQGNASQVGDFGSSEISVSGGVYYNWTGSGCTVAYGSSAVKGTTLTIVGKDLILHGDQILKGTLIFDPQGETYAGINLIDTDITAVTQSGDSWVVKAKSSSKFVGCASWDDLKTILSNGYNARLIDDIAQDSDVCKLKTSMSQTLDLNGHTLTRKAGTQLFVLNASSATLTVTGEGTVDGTVDTLNSTGGCFSVTSGTLVLQSGTLKGKALNGGAVAVEGSSAKFEMTGGTITESSASNSDGGGLYVASGSFLMTGGTIANCYAKTYGGGAALSYADTTISGGEISGCSTDFEGGGLYADHGSLTIEGGRFQGNTASRFGGAVSSMGASVSVRGGVYQGNTSQVGDFGSSEISVSGGVYYNWTGSGCTVASGSSAVKGTTLTFVGKDLILHGDQILNGTLTFDPQGGSCADLNLIDTDITAVTQSGDTWVVTAKSSSEFFDCATWSELRTYMSCGYNVRLTADITQDSDVCELKTLVSNTLDLNGHTLTRKSGTQLFVLNASGATLTVTGEGTVDGMVDTLSSNGGCISVKSGTLVLESGTLKGKAENGGAVAVTGSSAKFEMIGGAITGSSASASGGGVYISSSGQFELKGGEISGCSASSSYGGGVFAYGGKFIMRGGTLESNTASSSYGGGAAARSGGTIEVYDGTFRGNTACNGGAIEGWSNSSVTIKGGLFVDNLSTAGNKEHNLYCDSNLSVSGGVFNNGLESDVISYPSGYGKKSGPTYTFVGKDLVLDADQIQSGTLTYDPLGDSFEGVCIVDTDISTVTQSGDTWIVATANPIEYVECTDWKTLKETLEAGNNAKMMNDITQDSDTAYLTCGWGQTLNLNGHTLTRTNDDIWLFVLDAAGNILNVKGGGTVDGIANKKLAHDGGCFNVRAGRLVVKGGTFKGYTTKNGGAINVLSGATFEMCAGTITGSSAGGHGGGVHVDAGGTFTMTGGTIEKCTASADGGGIYVYGTATLSDCTISGNKGRYGGGIYARSGAITMTRVTVDGNAGTTMAGGVGVAEGATLTLDDCTLSNNSAGDSGGGGLYVDNSTAEMRSGTIADNKTSDSASSWDKSGGGVRVKNENARFTLSGGTISNNKASNGGGVSVTSKSYFLMTGGTISGNEATQDGGGGIAIEDGGEAIVTGGEIINNTAKKYGGAVRADGAFQMSYGVIEGNTAVSGGASIDFRKTASHSISGGVVFGSVSDNGAVTPITGGVYDNDVSKLVNTSEGWKSFACNGKYVIAQNNVSSANKFSTKDNKIYTGVFGFNVSDSIYSDHGVELDPSRFITQGSDGLWYIVAPPSIYVNGAPIDNGSGTGWKLANGIVTLSSAMTYTITGTSKGTDLGFVVSANATVELSSLTLTLGDASVTPFHFTSGASAGKLNLTGENTVYALDGHSAFEIDSGASVTLAGAGSLVGSSVLSGTRCFDVAGTLKLADGWDGLITLYNTTQDGGAVAVADGGTFTWSSGAITDCTGGNGGVLYNAGTATITNIVITGSHATANGGAIYNAGTLGIGCCRFEENSSSGTGGAIYSLPTKSARILSSSFNENTAKEFGGSLAGGGYFVLNATVINGKAEKQSGAGYYHESGSSEFVNVTFRDNVAKGEGGGIYAQAGSLKLVNVLAQGNKGGDYGDLCVIGASVSCYGVLAAKANITGGTDSRLNEGDVWNNIFKTGTGSKLIAVGESLQYVEELYNTPHNNAFSGYDGSAYKSDMSGRTFDKCQIGSFWQTYDRPSLTVESLDDTADTTDGFVTLRDILNGIADQNASYTALAVDGVYKIKFMSTLAGTLKMTALQYDIANASGEIIEVDGALGGGRLALQGYNVKTNSNKTVVTNAYRAFSVHAGNTLRLKNIDFTGQVGSTASRLRYPEARDGGAIANRGTLEVEDCTFTLCSAGEKSSNPTGYGGAIANGAKGVTGATATVSRCTFRDCRAAQGGAIYNFTGNSVVLDASTLESNRAGGGAAVLVAQGGAIRNETDATLAYDGCTFTDNTMILDGVDVPSDVNTNVLNSSAVSVSVAKGVMKVALSACAAPSLTTAASSSGEAASRRLNEDESSSDKRQDAASPSIDLSGEETMKDESGATVPAVAITPANVRPYLYYGLGRADSPDGEYKVSEWVQAGADGSLPESLKAPKTGDRGYYRVEVSLSGK